jgi:hypothetical protein
MILKCECGNEEEITIDESDLKRKCVWHTGKNFRIKISRHHQLHIDCLKCGIKIEMYA